MDLDQLKPEDFMDLPIDALALALLRAFTTGETDAFHHNTRSIRLTLEQGGVAPVASSQSLGDRPQVRGGGRRRHIHGSIVYEPSQDAKEAFFVTSEAWSVVRDDDGIARVRAARRLDVDLHERIEFRVRAQYLLGEYEAAAFMAMREVEIEVPRARGCRTERSRRRDDPEGRSGAAARYVTTRSTRGRPRL